MAGQIPQSNVPPIADHIDETELVYRVGLSWLSDGGYFGATYPGAAALLPHADGTIENKGTTIEEIEVAFDPGGLGIAVSPFDGGLWANIWPDNEFKKVNRDGTVAKTVTEPASGIHAFDLDCTDGTLWGCTTDGTAYNFRQDSAGTNLDSFAVTAGGSVEGLAVDVDGTLWVYDDSGTLQHLQRDGTQLSSISVSANYISVAIDYLDGTLWVADGNNATNLDREGTVIESIAHAQASVGVDPADGSLWGAGGRADQTLYRITPYSFAHTVTNSEGVTFIIAESPSSPDPPRFPELETGLSLSDAVGMVEQSADPSDPPAGESRLWQSDGTGSGSDGDIMVKITDSNGTTKTVTLIDFSTS